MSKFRFTEFLKQNGYQRDGKYYLKNGGYPALQIKGFKLTAFDGDANIVFSIDMPRCEGLAHATFRDYSLY